MKPVLLLALLTAAASAGAAPCSGVDRSLSAGERAMFAPAIEAHLKAQLDPRVGPLVRVGPADVLRVFRFGGWQIVHVDNHATDSPYLFYAGSPARSAAYLAAWAGGARVDEGREIKSWVLSNAPGIPKKLAGCFAWYVTKGIAE